MMFAAVNGHDPVADLLLRHGAEINLQSSKGGTALTRAADNGHERVVEVLIQHGAEINAQDNDGDTALTNAAFSGHERVVDLLLRGGAEIELQDRKAVSESGCARPPPAPPPLSNDPPRTLLGAVSAGEFLRLQFLSVLSYLHRQNHADIARQAERSRAGAPC